MLRRPVSAAARTAVLVTAFAAVVVPLSACTSSPAGPPSPSPAVATPSPDAAPSAPSFDPDGTAEDNLGIFRHVAEEIWATDQRGSGRAYIDALTAAGFDRGAMQVTQDRSTVGNPAESLQFSVRWGAEECLIGQVGPSTGQVVAAVMPQLAEGRCLIGATRPIDW
ncbi:DUF6993 domain-containing protein [Microbacterium sp. 179-I 3D3 NHS]|uniref:DUF6993 domain-containing protein n=1 Tax=unclassified Microbacterium TaxID=2609290 RepID=UPI0039A26077